VRLPLRFGRGRDDQPWRQEFPYAIDADEAIGRRHFLTLAVLTSGAVLLGTVGLALRGLSDDRRRGSPRAIGRADALEVGEAAYFTYPGADDGAVVVRLGADRFVAYSQKCTHLSCAVRYRPEKRDLHCPCHEGVFDIETGEPVAGPPRRRLPRIALRQEGSMLIALEEAP